MVFECEGARGCTGVLYSRQGKRVAWCGVSSSFLFLSPTAVVWESTAFLVVGMEGRTDGRLRSLKSCLAFSATNGER